MEEKKNLNKKNYYSIKMNEIYMSYSQFKDFLKCPACAMAKIKGEWEDEYTDSLLVGSYVDSWLDGELDKFKEQHPEIFNSRNGELKSNFKQADELCEVIKNDEYLFKMLKGKRQKIMTGIIAGVPFKIKIDSLHDDMIVDGKVLKDCEDCWIDGKYPFYMANRYDIQGAVYQTIVQQNVGKKLPFILGIVTKEKVPDKRLIKIQDSVLEDAKNEIIAKAPIFNDMKLGKIEAYRCECCDYCKSTKKLNVNSIEEM